MAIGFGTRAATAAVLPQGAAARARASSIPLWYLYTAIAALVLFCTSLIALAPEAVDGTLSPHVLALIHLATLGVMTTAIMGALWQLLPVILVVPAPRPWLSRAHYPLWVAGVAILVAGFWSAWWPALAVGGSLVVLGAGLFAAVMLWTIARAPRRPVSAYFVAAGLVYLVLVVLGGLTLAVDRQTGFLGDRLLRMLPAHLLLGFVGWGVGTVMGVSYKLGPMFALAHVADERPAWLCWGLLNGGLVTLAAGLLAGWPLAACLGPGALILLAIVVFTADTARILWSRHKKVLEPTQWHALAGLGFLLLCGGLTMRAALGGVGWWLDGRTAAALGLLFLLGFVGQTIMGYLYKIVPFLVWNRRYAPLVGRQKVPVMRDLIQDRAARAAFWLYNAGLIGLLAAVLWERNLIGPAASAVALATWLFGLNLAAALRPRGKGV
ncbi:MAG TPA: hypothetical protein VIJ28_00680 [Chloroflexota bacterium]